MSFVCVILQPPEVAGALGEAEAEAEADSGDGGDEADNMPSASSSLSEGKKRKRAKTQAQMDEALLKFLERPRQSEAVAEKVIISFKKSVCNFYLILCEKYYHCVRNIIIQISMQKINYYYYYY